MEQPIFIHYYLHHEMENNELDYILHLYASRVYLVAEIWLEKIFLIFKIFSYFTYFFLDFFTFPRKIPPGIFQRFQIALQKVKRKAQQEKKVRRSMRSIDRWMHFIEIDHYSYSQSIFNHFFFSEEKCF
jgi:hypothetical protein